MRVSVALLLALCLVPTVGLATGDGGTESPFAMGFGARDLALGGADPAGCYPTMAPVWSAARLATAQRFAVEGFHCRLYDSDVAYQYFGLAWPTLDFGTFGIGVARLGIDGIEKRDSDNYRLDDISDSRIGVYAAYGFSLGTYQTGLTVHLEHHRLDDFTSTSSPGIDLSVHRGFEYESRWPRNVTASLTVRNLLQPESQLDEQRMRQPLALDLGVAIGIGSNGDAGHSVRLAGCVTKVDRLDAEFAGGIEYTNSSLLSLRTGLRDSKVALGAGLDVGLIAFDYTIVDRDMGYLHMFSLSTSFGQTIGEKRARRHEKQEREFSQMMEERLHTRNRNLADNLVEEGTQALEDGELAAAVKALDRALFLSRATGSDTSKIASLTTQARTQLDRETNAEHLAALLDSASTRMDASDFVGAQYYARSALYVDSSSARAQSILQQVGAAMEAVIERESLIETQLLTIDSLLAYGRLADASMRADGLIKLAPEDPRVNLAVRRALFEGIRQHASMAFAQDELSAAMRLVDSALALFPDHQACLELRHQIASVRLRDASPAPSSDPAPPRPLGEETRRQVADSYQKGRVFFESGELPKAIEAWEEVERLAPGYESVREYLVSAYKFVGVQLYGEDRLPEAIEQWRRAAAIEPGNSEIQAYIERAENEFEKLRELSYEQ